jgi:uncharacterized membrane protein YGL010W
MVKAAGKEEAIASHYHDEIDFKAFDLVDALAYHLVYHRSPGIHINHLIFGQTYLFGATLLLLSLGTLYPSLAAMVTYVSYCVRMEYYLGMSYSTVILVVYFAAFSLWAFVLDRKPAYLLSIGIMVTSLLCQVVGHQVYELYQASPNLLHGLYSAPFLEWCGLWYRRRRYNKLFVDKFNAVDKRVKEMRRKKENKK